GGWQPGSTRNFGELIQPPLPMAEVSAHRADSGEPWIFENTDHHWSMLVKLPEPCDAACDARLELVRNVGVSMWRHRSRLSISQINGADIEGFHRLTHGGALPNALIDTTNAPEAW